MKLDGSSTEKDKEDGRGKCTCKKQIPVLLLAMNGIM
jgi:hypothetical protein